MKMKKLINLNGKRIEINLNEHIKKVKLWNTK